VYIPTAALDVTAKDQDGKVVLSKSKEYFVNDFYVRALDPKPEEVVLPVWRFDRQVHIHEGIEPGETDSNTYILPLDEKTKSVEIEAAFRYIYEKGKEAVWQKATKKIEF
jgi:hypothetical protein